jgi:HEAT repeat protein
VAVTPRERIRAACTRWGEEQVVRDCEELAPLLADPVPRVRAAAARAVGAVGEAEHAPALRALTKDPLVRDTAARALGRLAERLDRPL